MSLRKEKAARLKLAILEETHRLIGKRPFEDLYVEDICARVKISKVTFFKYFRQKEDLLVYHYRLWCFARAVELRQNSKTGLQGIYYLVDKLGDDAETYPSIMLSLIGYLADMKRPPKPFPVKIEEKVRLYPNAKNIDTVEIQSLEVMVEAFVLDSILKKEITKSTSTREIALLLTSVLYGSILSAYLTQQTPLKVFFRRNVDLVLKNLQ